MTQTKPSGRFALTSTDDADLFTLLRAVDQMRPGTPSTAEVQTELGWSRGDVLAGLREARMRGLLTGVVKDRSTLELVDIRLKPSARVFLRRNCQRFPPRAEPAAPGADATEEPAALDFGFSQLPCGDLSVWGEVDIDVAQAFATSIESCDAPEVVVDLRRVTFMDRSGVRAMLDARRACAGELVLLASPAVLRVLDITDTVRVFFCEDRVARSPADTPTHSG